MAKEITLEELAGSSKLQATPATRAEESNVSTGSFKNAKHISSTDLAKNLAAQHPEENKVVEEDAPVVANAFAAMEKTLADRKDYIENVMMPIVEENAREMAMENEINDGESEDNSDDDIDNEENFDIDDLSDVDDDIPEEEVTESYPTNIEYNEEDKKEETPVEEVKKEEPKPKKAEVKKETKDEEDDDDDATLDDLLEELNEEESEENDVVDDEAETADEFKARLKDSFKSVQITKDPINLGEFQIRKDPVSSTSILNTISSSRTTKKCDWPLFYTKRNMTFEECSGPELDALRKTINNSNGLNGVVASLKFVYNHVVDANKKSFEAWCKTIRTEDIESLYFGMYKACYCDANLVARTDADEKKGCKKVSLIDTPINDMVKFEDDEAKKEFNNLMIMDTTDPGRKIKSNMLVISDDLAISYTDPTLYSTFIQYASLKPNITEKYSDYLNTMAYIDGFFKIDRATKTLIPIAIKEYPNNINKTVLNKLKVYSNILKTLNTDQYNIMLGKLDNLMSDSKISYIYPETTCPECGETIPEEPIDSVLNLLFTRAQLVQVKSL